MLAWRRSTATSACCASSSSARGRRSSRCPPVPAGYSFAACLTHDIDFVGIRRHSTRSHTVLGFLYRSTAGAVKDWPRGRLSLARLLRMWRAMASPPACPPGLGARLLGAVRLVLEVGRRAFRRPTSSFRSNGGPEHVSGPGASRRATAYDVGDLSEWLGRLTADGREVGVHGIDAWHRLDRAGEEMSRVAAATGTPATGIRMHWLLSDAQTPAILEKAGYDYDATARINETVGFRHGTGQVFRPRGAHSLLALPLHIQDGALFYPTRLDLSEAEARQRCARLMNRRAPVAACSPCCGTTAATGPSASGAISTSAWFGSFCPANAWFGSARDVVGWFRKRRQVRFDDVCTRAVAPQAVLSYTGEGSITPPLVVRCTGRVRARGSRTPLRHGWMCRGMARRDSSRMTNGGCRTTSGNAG